jgi:hypothetical protein
MSGPTPRCVCIESPFRGDYKLNIAYADACMLDSLERGEAPFLGHLQFPRVLDDREDAQRDMGIAAHLAWLRVADFVAIYTDLGVRDGMRMALELCSELKIPFQYRVLPGFGDGSWAQRIVAIGGTREFLTTR